MDRKPTTRTVRVEIDSAEPIGGWIADDGQRGTRFDGWLQLISSLERAAGEVAAEASTRRAAKRPTRGL